MGEPSNTTKQSDPLGAVRTLLQTVQSPLTIWSDLLDAATGVLADLDPPLGLVAFSPFAALRTPEAAEQPPASQPLPRQQGAAAAPTAAIATPTTKPVFALLPRKREPAAAVALAQGHAGQQQTAPDDQDATEAQALLATMTQFATLTDTLLAGTPDRQDVPSPALAMAQRRQAGPGGELSTASADRAAPLSAAQLSGADNSGVSNPLAVAGEASWQAMTTAATVATADGALAETMALLASLTDTLLTSPNAGGAVHTAPSPSMSEQQHASGFSSSSTLPTAAKTVHTQTPLSPPPPMGPPGVADEAVRGESPFPEGTGPSVMPTAALAASPAFSAEALSPETLAGGPLAPPDAWTLAQLINDVLAEEARRHGVDLS